MVQDPYGPALLGLMRRSTVLMGEAWRPRIILTVLEGSCRWHGSLEVREEVSG
jgi:hypothetical protein